MTKAFNCTQTGPKHDSGLTNERPDPRPPGRYCHNKANLTAVDVRRGGPRKRALEGGEDGNKSVVQPLDGPGCRVMSLAQC